jgi:molybdate transport system substrate-binding protein
VRGLGLSALILVATVLPACGRREAEVGPSPLTVAAAISLKDALAQVARDYRDAGGGPVEFTYGSSGQLATQIRGGAPIDLFISAAHQQIDDLVRAGFVDADSTRVIAGNRLVVIVPASSAPGAGPSDLKQLAEARYARVATGEPRTVPAGQYAEQALRGAGVADRVRGRLVYGANVRQVLDYVQRGEVDAGIVYATDARQAGAAVRVTLEIDPTLHDPVEYPAAAVKASKRPDLARRFLDYLTSPKAREAFAAHGFTDGARRP